MNRSPEFERKYLRMGDYLGKGRFGMVEVVMERSTRKMYAVKVIDTSGTGNEEFARSELEALTLGVGHENIVQMVEHFVQDKTYYVVMEKLDGGSLSTRLFSYGALKEKDAAFVVFQVAMALAFLHGIGIVHRDVKPDNILLARKDRFEAKLADFGLCLGVSRDPSRSVHGPEESIELAGTAYYMAPEVIALCLAQDGVYGKECDLWSLGVVTAEILTKEKPFLSRGACRCNDCRRCCASLIESVCAGVNFQTKQWTKISHYARNLVTRLLKFEKTERMRAEEVASHLWIKRHVLAAG